jgi:hypothetical protein
MTALLNRNDNSNQRQAMEVFTEKNLLMQVCFSKRTCVAVLAVPYMEIGEEHGNQKGP